MFIIPVPGKEANAWPPKTQYCLKIQVTLTEEAGATPPSPHTWQASMVEDMLHDSKAGLTEVIVMGPGQALRFYGKQLLGEGLSLGEVQDVMFMLSGALSWVCLYARLNANALSLWEGQWLIGQAITKWHSEARGPGCPHSHLPASLPSRFCSYDGSHGKRVSRVLTSMWRSPGVLVGCHTMTETGHHNAAWTAARGDKTCGQHQPQHLNLHQNVGPRVTEVHCQLPHWCHHSPTDLGAPGIHTMANAAGSLEAE